MNTRQAAILEILRSNGEADIHQLAERFDVSEMTIRRDLTALNQEEEITRTRGGAILSRAGIIEFTFKEKERKSAREKQAIATAAVSWIEPGMTLTLDTGTTTLEVARQLAGFRSLTVLTSSLAIASVLYPQDNIELVLLGGTVRKGNPDLTGWLTEENLKQFRVDLAMIGADGAGPQGIFTTDMNIARVSQSIISSATQTVLLLDHNKFQKTAFVKFADWNQIHHLITDAGTTPNDKKWLNRIVKQITYAKVKQDRAIQ